MAVLHALGIDVTVLLQFVVASFAFFALSTLVFKPYTDALLEREKRTKGGEEAAADLTKKAADLRATYEKKAREVSSQIKAIFDSFRAEAGKEHEVIVSKARAQAGTVLETARKQAAAEMLAASQKMKEEVPQVSQAIVSKLLSKKA